MKRIHPYLLLIIVVVFFLPPTAEGQNKQPLPQQQVVQSLSLKQAQDYAIANNATNKNASLDLKIAKQKIKETTAIGLPQINAQGNYTHTFKIPEMSFGGIPYLKTSISDPNQLITAGDLRDPQKVSIDYIPMPPVKLGVKDNITADFTVSQLIFSGEYIVGLQSSKTFYKMSEQMKEKNEQDIKESVANTYNLILLLQQNLQVLHQTHANIEKTWNDMKAMYKQGFIENTDVDQMEITSLNITNTIHSLERQTDAAYDLLKFQIGMPAEQRLVLTDKFQEDMDTLPIGQLISAPFNVENNIGYRMLGTQEELGKLNLKREQSTFLPSLMGIYRHSEKIKKQQLDFAPKDLAMLTLTIPIFSSGQRIAKVHQRQLELEKITNTKNSTADALRMEYITAQNDLKTAYDNYLNEKRNIDLAKRIYEKTIVKYKNGLSSSLDITNTQNQYLTAQSNYYKSIYSLITAKNKLYKITSAL